MPQYRLFGDTVDVAGMMTITGEGEVVVVFSIVITITTKEGIDLNN